MIVFVNTYSSETLSGRTNSSWCGIYMYGGTFAIIVAHATHTYIMRAELGHTHIFILRASRFNVVITGNGLDTKNVFKWNGALWFVFSVEVSSLSKGCCHQRSDETLLL